MSTINKMSIKGIRSFGANRDGEQTITFSSPLTLIVGENGCGKTTIIECLKYGLTGETPPGSDKGKTFVNDPKVNSTNSVMGQVKLMVTDVLGNHKNCTRSMKVENTRAGGTKFTTLDSTITYEDKNGVQRKQEGKKVEETNNEMCTAMGVSKAVLNNVIFCHQEDSNWPLDEGKKLKEKFDAIFGTTDYNKAITKILGIVKGYTEDLKLAKKEREHKEQIRNDEEKKSLNYENQKKKLEEHNDEIKKVNELKADYEAQLTLVRDQITKFQDIRAKRKNCEVLIKNKDEQIESLKQSIKEILSDSEDSIQDQLDQFSSIIASKTAEQESLKREHVKMSKEETQHQGAISDYKAKIQVCADKIGQMQSTMDHRIEFMKKTAKKMNLNLSIDMETQSLEESDIEEAIEEIKTTLKTEEENLQKLRKNDAQEDQAMQEKIDEVQKQKTQIQTENKSTAAQIREVENKRTALKSDISQIEASMPGIIKLDQDIEKHKKSIEKLKSTTNLESLESKKSTLESQKESKETEIAVLDDEIDEAEKFQSFKTEIEQKEKELKSDQSDLERTKNKQTSTLKLLFSPNVPSGKFKAKVQEIQSKLESECRMMNENITTKRTSLNRCKTELEHYKKQLDSKKTDSQKIKSNIEELCGDRDYLDVLTATHEKKEKLNLELAFVKASESTYKHYISDIQDQTGCPLCHKNLKPNERDDLRDEIQDKIRQLPVKLSETEKKFKKESANFDKLNAARSSYETISKIEKEIENLESQIKKNKSLESQLLEEIDDIEMNLSEPSSKLQGITSSFIIDMQKLDDLQRKIHESTQKIDSLKTKIPANAPSKSVQQLKEERKKLSTEVKSMNDELNRISKQISEFQKEIHRLQEQLNKMITRKASEQEKIQGLERMRIELDELVKTKSNLTSKIAENNLKTKPIEENLSQLQKDKKEQKEARTNNINKMQAMFDDHKSDCNEIARLTATVKNYENLKLNDQMEKYETKINDHEAKKKSCESKKTEVDVKIRDCQEYIAQQEGNKRNLQDNMLLRKHEREKAETVEKFNKLKVEGGEQDLEKLRTNYQHLNDKIFQASTNKSRVQGMIDSLKEDMKTNHAELQEDRYKNAKRNYLKECYNVGILEASISDLKIYRAVLEKAVIKFHQDKMNQINQSIKEYWNSIYRGNDIDYIMIKTSEDDEGGSKINKEEKRRSYSYRVVQCKNGGAEIDMRGRCSAGQKVLASLIIRMALADTFSVNCGILALDEPTTNLDHNNIKALTQALSQIVEEREKMNNRFMLVVITHDMDFVKELERAEHYYQVSRDNYGHSRIDRIDSLM